MSSATVGGWRIVGTWPRPAHGRSARWSCRAPSVLCARSVRMSRAAHRAPPIPVPTPLSPPPCDRRARATDGPGRHERRRRPLARSPPGVALGGGEIPMGAGRSVRGAGYGCSGVTTVSMTWMTPLPARTSAAVTLAPLIVTLPSASSSTRSVPPWTVATSVRADRQVRAEHAAGDDVVGEDARQRGLVLEEAGDRALGQLGEGRVRRGEDRERALALERLDEVRQP